MRKHATLPEQQPLAFDTILLESLDSKIVLETSMANLAEQGIVYGATNAAETLEGSAHLTVEQRHQKFYLQMFHASAGLVLGLEDRIDPVKYAHRVMVPIVHENLDAVVASTSGTKQLQNSKAPRAEGRHSHELPWNGIAHGAKVVADSIKSGVDALIEDVPAAVARMKIIKEQADAVVPALKAEISQDTEKEFTVLKLLASNLAASDIEGFRDPALTLATFLGIADYDTETDRVRIIADFEEKLRDGYFDRLIAREMIADAMDKAYEGDILTVEETELVRMIEQAKYVSGRSEESVIDAFTKPEGVELWPPSSNYLLIGKRDSFVRSLKSCDRRLQDLIYENCLGSVVITEAEFTELIGSAIGENAQTVLFSGGDVIRSNRLRDSAEAAQRAKRVAFLTRLVGANALNGTQVEAASAAIRPLVYLHLNGDRTYVPSDDSEPIVSRYLDLYRGNQAVAEDLDGAFDYLCRLSAEEMTILLTQGTGLSIMSGQSVRVNGKNHPVCRMKPNRLPGFRPQAPETSGARVMFVQLKTGKQGAAGAIGIIDVTRVDRMSRARVLTTSR